MTVYVYFCKGTSWLSKLLRFFTGQGPSHAALAWVDPNLGPVTLTAEWNGWVLRSCTTVGDVSAVYRFPQYDLWVGLRACRGLFGSPYDYLGAFVGQGLVSALWAWLHVKIRNPLKSTGSVFCSDATARVLVASGVPLGIDPGSVDPGQLEEAVNRCLPVRCTWLEVIN